MLEANIKPMVINRALQLPAFVYLGERIQINGQAISEAKILEYCERLKSAAQEISHVIQTNIPPSSNS